jgi:hypothetical protein
MSYGPHLPDLGKNFELHLSGNRPSTQQHLSISPGHTQSTGRSAAKKFCAAGQISGPHQDITGLPQRTATNEEVFSLSSRSSYEATRPGPDLDNILQAAALNDRNEGAEPVFLYSASVGGSR